MSMNKKECRRFADPEMRFDSGNGMFLLKNIRHVVRAAVKNIRL
jgi:hypothetical protein